MTAVADETVDFTLVLDEEPDEPCFFADVDGQPGPCPRTATHWHITPCHRAAMCLPHTERTREEIQRAAALGAAFRCAQHRIVFTADDIRIVPKGRR